MVSFLWAAPLVAANLAGNVLAAGCNDACDRFGCNPAVQVVVGNTYVTEPRDTHPFTDPAGLTNPTQIGAQVNGQATLVTWQAAEPTTLVVPKATPAIDGLPGTSYYIATQTISLGGVVIEKPYVASSTYQPYTCPPPPTVTETSTSYPPPFTTTETSISILQVVTTETTTETSVSVLVVPTVTTDTFTITSTQTETSVSVLVVPTITTDFVTITQTVPTTVTYCPPNQGGQTPPPPPVCQNRVFKAWDKFTLTKNPSTGQVTSFTFQTNNIDAPAYLTVTDSDYKLEKYTISVGGVFVGATSDFVADKSKYCKGSSSKNGDLCIADGFSWTKVAIPAGVNTVTISGANLDQSFPSWSGLYKLEEKCD